MDWLELVFLVSAVGGGTLFVLRMVMMVVGGLDFGDSDLPQDLEIDAGDGLDFDLDHNADFGMDGDIDHPSTEISFKFLSLQGLTAFFMMFGLVGLAIYRTEIWPIFAVGGGAIAGVFTVWVIGIIFALMGRLQSEGTMDVRNAVGQQGTVYLTIPESGSGQIQVVVQGGLQILDAVSSEQERIPTGEKVKVVGVIDNKTLSVIKN